MILNIANTLASELGWVKKGVIHITDLNHAGRG
jgi:uncharacterized membrane protein